MRYLTWYSAATLKEGRQGQTYVMDGDYNPKRAWVHLTRNPSGTTLIVDMQVGGVSLFPLRPTLQASQTQEEETVFSAVQIKEGSLITCNIIQVPSGETGGDMTACLELEEV